MYPLLIRKKLLKIKVEEKTSIRKLAKRFGIIALLKKDVEENPDIYS